MLCAPRARRIREYWVAGPGSSNDHEAFYSKVGNSRSSREDEDWRDIGYMVQSGVDKVHLRP